MGEALVRGVLWRHLAASHPRVPAPAVPAADLVPAAPFADALAAVARAHGDAELRRLAADHVALWARTFQVLVRHLRGRPERALALWADEVYPFLRGRRLAARVEGRRRGHARLVVEDDLPPAFVAGLAASFVALTGAKATCEHRGGGVFEVRHRLGAGERLAGWTQRLALLRIPLLVSAMAAGVVGVAVGSASAAAPNGLAAALALVGLVAAQAGANGAHDLRGGGDRGALGPVRPARAWSWAQAAGSYAVAAACAAALASQGRLGIVPFAAAGLAAGLLYARFRDGGAGPLLAGVTYGPLAVAGAAYAVAGPAALLPATLAAVLLPGVAVGALAAALLLLGDVADRPLDEAGGHRTLAVRLPGPRQALLYAGLLALGLASLAAWGPLGGGTPPIVWALLGALPAALLVRRVRVHLDDPHGLAPARAGTLGLLAGLALLFAVTFGGAP